MPSSRSFPVDLTAVSERPILAYAVAFGSCVNALLLTLVVGASGDKPLFFAFLTAIAISSWFAGWRPGLAAMLLSFAVVAVLEYRVAQGRAAGSVALDLAFVFHLDSHMGYCIGGAGFDQGAAEIEHQIPRRGADLRGCDCDR